MGARWESKFLYDFSVLFSSFDFFSLLNFNFVGMRDENSTKFSENIDLEGSIHIVMVDPQGAHSSAREMDFHVNVLFNHFTSYCQRKIHLVEKNMPTNWINNVNFELNCVFLCFHFIFVEQNWKKNFFLIFLN